MLEITILNNMVIPIGTPINVKLLRETLGSTIEIPGAEIEFNELIEANNGSAVGMIDLSGLTLPGELFVQVSGTCQKFRN